MFLFRTIFSSSTICKNHSFPFISLHEQFSKILVHNLGERYRSFLRKFLNSPFSSTGTVIFWLHFWFCPHLAPQGETPSSSSKSEELAQRFIALRKFSTLQFSSPLDFLRQRFYFTSLSQNKLFCLIHVKNCELNTVLIQRYLASFTSIKHRIVLSKLTRPSLKLLYYPVIFYHSKRNNRNQGCCFNSEKLHKETAYSKVWKHTKLFTR